MIPASTFSSAVGSQMLEEQAPISDAECFHASSLVKVVDYEHDKDQGGIITPKIYEFADATSFAQFLHKPCKVSTPSRLIHIRNAAWARKPVQEHTECDLEDLLTWLRAPTVSTNPRERVWKRRTTGTCTDLRFAYEYFATHPDGGRPCPTSRYVKNLEFSHYETGKPTKWAVCLQRMACACISLDDRLKGRDPGTMVVILEDTDGCPSDCEIPVDILKPRETSLSAEKLTHRFFDHVMYFVVRHSVTHWFQLIRGSQASLVVLETAIFANPEDERLGDILWRSTQKWNLYGRLLTIQRRMMSYLKLQAEKFLRFHTQSWRNLGEIEDTTHLVGGHHGEWKLFGQLHRTFDTNQEEVNQGLINPTAIMLDMIYKRVAIRDSRLSLTLNQSLWRLSWITFIFLPLTFITGVFGMNVDLLADNPSIKWWFIVAIPLMLIVFLCWFSFRSAYSISSRKRLESAPRGLSV